MFLKSTHEETVSVVEYVTARPMILRTEKFVGL